MTKSQLCETCGAHVLQPDKSGLDLPTLLAGLSSQWQDRLAQVDPRYSRAAYALVMLAVEQACRAVGQQGHVTAADVADAFHRLALARFGPQALPTLAGLGLHTCDDLGAMVFQLVSVGILGSRPGESAQDFSGLYDFAAAFPIAF